MRILVLAALLAVLPPVAAAAEDAAKEKAEPGTRVEMPFLIAPVSVNGRLIGYIYISSKLQATSPAASVEIRDKLAFIQDAFVRDVNRSAVSKASDPESVDTAALSLRLVADAKRVAGAGKVSGIIFTQMQFSPLHPRPSTEDAIPPSERASAMGAPAQGPPAGSK